MSESMEFLSPYLLWMIWSLAKTPRKTTKMRKQQARQVKRPQILPRGKSARLSTLMTWRAPVRSRNSPNQAISWLFYSSPSSNLTFFINQVISSELMRTWRTFSVRGKYYGTASGEEGAPSTISDSISSICSQYSSSINTFIMIMILAREHLYQHVAVLVEAWTFFFHESTMLLYEQTGSFVNWPAIHEWTSIHEWPSLLMNSWLDRLPLLKRCIVLHPPGSSCIYGVSASTCRAHTYLPRLHLPAVLASPVLSTSPTFASFCYIEKKNLESNVSWSLIWM